MFIAHCSLLTAHWCLVVVPKMVWWKARRLKKRTRSSIEIQRVYRAYRLDRGAYRRREMLCLEGSGRKNRFRGVVVTVRYADLTISSMFSLHTFPSFRALLLVIRVRLRVQVLREERLALLAKGSQATPIQAIFRGFVTRKNDKLVRVSLPLVSGSTKTCRTISITSTNPVGKLRRVSSLAIQRCGHSIDVALQRSIIRLVEALQLNRT